MKKIIRQLRYFLIPVGCFLAAIAVAVFSMEKLSLHLAINQQNNPLADVFFKYYTNVGDGVVGLLLLPYLYHYTKFKKFTLALASCLLGGLLAQFFKRVVFSKALRPEGMFEQGALHIVDGVDLHHIYSFPSGHTASAFAMFIFIAYLYKKRPAVQLISALLAILAGYSRVYLSHHFLIDIFGGAIVGMSGFFLAYFLQKRFKFHKIDSRLFAFVHRVQLLRRLNYRAAK